MGLHAPRRPLGALIAAGARYQRAVRIGGNHDSIEETGPEVFQQHRPARYLRPRVLDDGPLQGSDL